MAGFSYSSYSVVLFILSGLIILLFDTRASGEKKEVKISRFLGWTNISLGMIGFIGILVF